MSRMESELSAGAETGSSFQSSRFSTQDHLDGDREDLRDSLKASELVLQNREGGGNHADVYKAIWWRSFESSTSAITVAVKMLRQGSGIHMSASCDQIVDRIAHPNIVRCFATPKLVPDLIVSEYCPGGSLYTLIHNSDQILSWTQHVKVLLDIAKGMEFLHNCKPAIIHRDLRSHNVLILAKPSSRQFPVAKVGDYGLVRAAQPSVWMFRGAELWRWMAPEVFTSSEFSEPCDVYSFAMLMFEMLSRQLPFADLCPNAANPSVGSQIKVQILSGSRPSLKRVQPGCPSKLLSIMQDCWASNPLDRPNFPDIRLQLEQQFDECSQAS